MQTKVVKTVRENMKAGYTGRNGEMFIHGITLEGDPQEWEYHSVSPQCVKFQPGQEVTYTTEIKQNAQYTNYRITPVNIPTWKPSFQGKAPYKAEPKDQGVITALSAASTAAQFYQERTADPEMLLQLAEKIFNWANTKSIKQ